MTKFWHLGGGKGRVCRLLNGLPLHLSIGGLESHHHSCVSIPFWLVS
jgi:hypothetical protein